MTIVVYNYTLGGVMLNMYSDLSSINISVSQICSVTTLWIIRPTIPPSDEDQTPGIVPATASYSVRKKCVGYVPATGFYCVVKGPVLS